MMPVHSPTMGRMIEMNKRIVHHYRLYGGTIACSTKSYHLDATSVEAGVTCKRCLAVLRMWHRHGG